ncbi:hypothetical protein GCM10027277_57380 [Pseudoduganella ginsengisoli]|uniref:BPSL0067 family protein n=1 Tax=Pseudoduganella ginsengisoli TaxID=1462440 RepID=A0A6L6Q3E6_9BURK|nr:BPSL0067 family protein [Pseudoduganella ginsengisoli]MTW03592.1 BPSL0067 family protein [Pseudoduganella ginsengisoli]
MAYLYARVEELEESEMVGTQQCVALIRFYANAPATFAWRQGERVIDSTSPIQPGTAIATFVNGRYPSHQAGNHAAFYLRPGAGGFYVMDQWKNKPDGKVSSRFIPSLGKDKRGKFIRPSNNADAYFIIE